MNSLISHWKPYDNSNDAEHISYSSINNIDIKENYWISLMSLVYLKL